MAERFDNCEAVWETDKALKVIIPEIDVAPKWVPKWAVHDDSEVYRNGDEGTLVLKTRFCENEGWI